MITVEHLSKAFGAKLAVDDVSFTVERGEVLGFLGPNGAGKSTTMRVVTGFYPPTSGKVTVGGYDMLEDPIPAKRLIGYLPENAPGYADMTVHGFLNFAAELRGIHGAARKQAIGRAVGLCFLENVLHQTIDTLSKGYKHRTCLAQALIHDPDILIMDEPFGSLDAQTRAQMQEELHRLWEKRLKTVVLITHDVEEAIHLADRVVVFTARPGRVKTDVAVELPRPRALEVRLSPEFAALKRRIWAELEVERYSALRVLTQLERGEHPGAGGSVTKLSYSEFEKRFMELAEEILGPYGQLTDGAPPEYQLHIDTAVGERGTWAYAYLWSRAGTIYAGSSEIQKNVIGERILGLPKEARADRAGATR